MQKTSAELRASADRGLRRVIEILDESTSPFIDLLEAQRLKARAQANYKRAQADYRRADKLMQKELGL